MKSKLNLENWSRKEHFEFFRKFKEPFFGVTVDVDCSKAYQKAKDIETSFFMFYLHKTLVAVNQIEAFRYRISEDGIYVYDIINASATISRLDNSFGFSLIKFDKDFTVFSENALLEIERVKNTSGLFTREFSKDNLIHFSAIPFINFTSLSHARSFSFADSCPKISFGKLMLNENGTRKMSMSVHVHHGLMDGFHLGQFIDLFQNLMNE
jgi:chloramphenicol O-acetyltransferase type A